MYDQYVRYNKLISPVNGYSTKRILMSNIKKFGFDSIDDLHSKYPNFPLFCQETLEKLEYKSKKFSDKKKLSDIENYNISPKSCLNCSNIFTYETRNNKFCNSACSASYNNKKRTNRSVESKIKTSNSLKKFFKENPIKTKQKRNRKPKQPITKFCACCQQKFETTTENKCCSPECARKNSTYRKIVIPYEHNGEIVFLESTWELKIAEWLDQHSIKWIRPKHIPWVDNKGKNRKYFPDFYLCDFNIYVDPKNDYQIKIGKEKIEIIQKSHILIYGKVEYIISELSKFL